jgi:probable HAF family extracellular repeat protein
MQNLGTLGGTESEGLGINGRGDVTGLSETANGNIHAFLWNGTVMQDLATLGGPNSFGSGINGAGEVVGYSISSNGAAHAFLWDGTAMLDLNTLLISSDGWDLTAANGINDAGQITGEGTVTLNGGPHAFLLTPVPEPATLPLAGIVLLAAGIVRRPRHE